MKRMVVILFSILLLIMIGCQSTAEETENTQEGSFSIIDFAERTITFNKTPKNIVALGNGETDIIYALGKEVVGRPTGDAIIPEAESALEVGSTHSIDLEKVTSLEPDVVLGNHPMNTKDIQAIENIGAEMVLTSANSVDDILNQIRILSDLLDRKETAEELINQINDKITSIQSEISEQKKPRILLIYGAPGTNMAALPNSLSGNILELAGGENIASDYPSLEMYPQYAQLNTERIIESNPQMILLMSHGDPEAVKESFIKDMSSTAGWDELDAVKNDHFIILPSDLFGTNPGTKVIEALDYLHELLKDVKE